MTMRRAVFVAIALLVLVEAAAAGNGSTGRAATGTGSVGRTSSTASATGGGARRGKADTPQQRAVRSARSSSSGGSAGGSKRKKRHLEREEGQEKHADHGKNTAGAKSRASQRRKRKPSSRGSDTRTRPRSPPGAGPAKKSARSSSSSSIKSDADARHEIEHTLTTSDGDGDDTQGDSASEDDFAVHVEDEDGGYLHDHRRGAEPRVPQGSSRRTLPRGSKTVTRKKTGMMKGMSKLAGKSTKAIVRTLQPKSVGLGEILDTWKLEQVVGKPPGRVTKCAATIEFRRDGTVVTSYDGRESVSDFTFRAHSWPRACTIEFEAKAFQGPWDEEPVSKLYKGAFSRKLLDPKIITLEGNIYDVMGKMMWRRRVKSGAFIALRRPTRTTRSSRSSGVRSYRGGATSDATPPAIRDDKRGTRSNDQVVGGGVDNGGISRRVGQGFVGWGTASAVKTRRRTWINGGDRARSARAGRQCRDDEF